MRVLCSNCHFCGDCVIKKIYLKNFAEQTNFMSFKQYTNSYINKYLLYHMHIGTYPNLKWVNACNRCFLISKGKKLSLFHHVQKRRSMPLRRISESLGTKKTIETNVNEFNTLQRLGAAETGNQSFYMFFHRHGRVTFSSH